MKPDIKIGLIGSGNVATHLSKALYHAGFRFSWVYSKTPEKAQRLARELGTVHAPDFPEPPAACDIIIVSVNDDALKNVLRKITAFKVPVVHTSGTVSLKVLQKFFKHAGVLYPLQTFTASREISFLEVPIIIEASDKPTLKMIHRLACALSRQVVELNSRQRQQLHIAAVFACNYSNYMFTLAEELLRVNNLPFEWLHPLIRETTEKAIALGPGKAQTGPAVRKDLRTIKQHLALLKNRKELKEVYEFLSTKLTEKNQGK